MPDSYVSVVPPWMILFATRVVLSAPVRVSSSHGGAASAVTTIVDVIVVYLVISSRCYNNTVSNIS